MAFLIYFQSILDNWPFKYLVSILQVLRLEF